MMLRMLSQKRQRRRITAMILAPTDGEAAAGVSAVPFAWSPQSGPGCWYVGLNSDQEQSEVYLRYMIPLC